MKTLITLLIGLSLAAFAQPRRGEELLGEARVDGAVDHDRIAVTGARGEFRAIKLRVEGGAVQFDRVIVHYANGASNPVQIRRRIPAGGETRVIDLPGDRRIIQSVEFWYAKANWRSEQRPRVLLFGLH